METEPKKFNLGQIIIGIVLGLVLAFVFSFIFNFFENPNKVSQTKTQKLLNLVINSPSDDTATSDKTVTVAGTTGINSVVTVSSGTQSKIVSTSGDTFSAKLDLTEGKNTVTVVAYNADTAESQTKTIDILYLNEDLTSLWNSVYLS